MLTIFINILFFLFNQLQIILNFTIFYFNLHRTFYMWGPNRYINFWFFSKKKGTFRKKKRIKSNKNFFGFIVLTGQLKYRRSFNHLRNSFKNFIFKRKFLCTQFCMGKQKNFFKYCLQTSYLFCYNISKCKKLFYFFLFRPAYTLLFVKFANWLPISNLLIKYGYLSVNGVRTKNRNTFLKIFDCLSIHILILFYLKHRFKPWLFRSKKKLSRNFERCSRIFYLSIISYKVSDKLFFTKFNYLANKHLKYIS